jgi:hypothetical protein
MVSKELYKNPMQRRVTDLTDRWNNFVPWDTLYGTSFSGYIAAPNPHGDATSRRACRRGRVDPVRAQAQPQMFLSDLLWEPKISRK